MRNCRAYRSRHVFAWTLVFNANPEIMTMVQQSTHESFVDQLTQLSLAAYADELGLDEGCLEYSYVVHFRRSLAPESPGLPNPHSHVILPGTLYSPRHGQRIGLYFSRRRRDVQLLHRVTEQTMASLMVGIAGPDWQGRFDTLEAIRERQRLVMSEPSHGIYTDPQGRAWPQWIGVRRTDERLSAVGLYRLTMDEAAAPTFRPLVPDLPHDAADPLSRALAEHLRREQHAQMAGFFADVRELRQLPAAQWPPLFHQQDHKGIQNEDLLLDR